MEKYIPLVNQKNCRKIWIKDVLYIDQQGRQVNIATEDGVYRNYDKVCNVEMYISGAFYHCLKNTVVNFDKVEKMCNNTIYFVNGATYGLGDNNYRHTRQAFAAYLKNPHYFMEHLALKQKT